MALLPQVPRRFTLTDEPRTAVTGADVARPGQQLAAGIQDIAGALIRKADQWEAATKTGQAARIANEARNTAQRLAIEAKGDPAAFQSSYGQWAQSQLAGLPDDIRGPVEGDLIEVGGQTYRGMIDSNFDRSTSEDLSAIKATRERLESELTALAYAGQTDSGDFNAKAALYRRLGEDAAANPLFKIDATAEEWASDNFEAMLTVEAVRGEVERTFASSPAEAAAYAREVLNDPSLALTPAQRQQAINGIMGMFSARSAEVREDTRILREDANRLTDALGTPGTPYDPADVTDILTRADQLGQPTIRRKIERALRNRQHVETFRGTERADRVQVYERDAASAASGIPPVGMALLDTIAGTESGGHYNVLNGFERFDSYADHPRRVGRGGTTTAAGRYQFVKATWDRAAAALGLTDFSPASQDKAAWWLAQEDYRARTGRDLLADLQSGDPATVASVRRNLKATWAGLESLGDNAFNAKIGAGPTSAGGAAIDPAVLEQERAILQTDLGAMIDEGNTVVEMGWGLDAATGSDLVDFARAVDDEGLSRKVADLLARSMANDSVNGMSDGEAAALLSELSQPGVAGTEYLRATMLDAVEKNAAHRAELRATNPYRLGLEDRLYEAAPIDFATPQTIASGLADRSRKLALLEADQGGGPFPLLEPAEAEALKRQWAGMAVDQRVGMLGAIAEARLPAGALQATLSQFAADEATRALSVAGALARVNPDAAAGIVRGEKLLAENPRLAPEEKPWRQAADAALPPSALGPDLEGVRQSHLQAIKYRYASLAYRDGDLSGEVNADRLDQAVDDVLGGRLDFNGETVIAPRYGMAQSDFDALMAALPDDALAGAMTADGTPIAKADLFDGWGWFGRSGAHLRAVADGRYLVDFDGAFALSRDGGAFVLDLRPTMQPLRTRPPVERAPGFRRITEPMTPPTVGATRPEPTAPVPSAEAVSQPGEAADGKATR